MSKRLNSSGNTTYDAKMKSSFGKSTSRISDYTAYQNGKEKPLKAKIQLKKVPSIQKKEIKEKPELFLNELDKDVQDIDQKGQSDGTEENIVIECIKEVQASILFDSERGETYAPEVQERRNNSQDDKIKNCDITNLKSLLCQKLNDCDFFTGEENIRNSSKRLLFMEYKNTQIYINKSVQKSKMKDQVSKEIRETFKTRKSPDNYFSINSRIQTQDTYDTDKSAKAKMTPQSLSPRLAETQINSTRRNSFICSQSVTLPLSLIDKSTEDQPRVSEQPQEQQYEQIQYQQQTQSMFYPQNYYWNSGYQSLNMSNYYSQNHKSSRMSEGVFQTYNINVNNIELDGRTTLMVKNIPNKYTREMLIQLFDKTERKKYDFLYLPIDPDNSCNIGYAFINFLDCSHIKDFYQRFDGKKWECFNSEKICRLTYARMQGTSSLAEHIEFSVGKQKRRNVQQGYMAEMNIISDRQRQDHVR